MAQAVAMGAMEVPNMAAATPHAVEDIGHEDSTEKFQSS